MKSAGFSDTFSKEAFILLCSQRSEYAVTPATSRPDDAFFDHTANSIIRGDNIINRGQDCVPALIFSVLNIDTFFPIKAFNEHLSFVWTFTVFSLVVQLFPLKLTVNFRSTVSH